MGYAFHSLRERLLLLMLFASLPVLALVVHSAISQRADAVEAAERSARSLVTLATREQSQLIADTRQMLVTLSRLPAIAPAAPSLACRFLLAELFRTNLHYTNIGVAGIDGDIYCSAVEMTAAVNIADRSYFRRAVDSRGFAIGDYQIGRVTGVSAVNFGYPLFDGQGDVIAVVYAALSLSWLHDLAGGVNLPDGSTVTLIDSNGTILARMPETESWTGRALAGTPLVDAVLLHRREGGVTMVGLDGVPRLYSFAPLYEGATGSVYVSVGIPKSVMFAPVDRAIANMLLLLLGVLLLALAVGWYSSNALIIRPVHAITRAARRLTEGDMTARTGLLYGDDELGALASDFDRMASTLQRVNRALKTLSAGNQALIRAHDEDQLLVEMCRIIVNVGSYHAAWVAEVDRESAELRLAAIASADGNENVGGETRAVSLDYLAKSGSRLAALLHSGKGLPLRFHADEPGFWPWPDCARRETCAGCLIFPLRVEDEIVNILAIYTRDTAPLDAEERELLQEAADDLAYGIAMLRIRDKHRKASETIMHMLTHDELTGLPNHAFLERYLHGELSARKSGITGLLLVDIERFREINSALGFPQGDQMLQEAARRLREIAGDGNPVARMRGDEFAILCVSRNVDEMADEVLEAFEKPFQTGGLSLAVNAVIGIAHYPDHGNDIERLVRHADVALHGAKVRGRRILVYKASEEVDLARSLTIAGELKHAIDAGDLELYYQPKIQMHDLSLCGVEALVRWRHPVKGMIPPGEFISLAERTGLIRPLTCWVLEAALRQGGAWSAGGRDIRIAVNLSARNLQDALLTGQLRSLFTRTGTRPDRLEIELTESAVMDDPMNAMKILNSLSESGVRLYIDDFGTGYSSLAYLQRLPVKALKIDKSFVTDMLKDEDLAKIVRSTIDLAHDLDLTVVAEGVEDIETWNSLLALDCDAAQGFLICRPLPAAGFEQWLREWQADPRRCLRSCG